MSVAGARSVILNGVQGALPGRIVASQTHGEHAVALFPATDAGRQLRLSIDPGGIVEMAILQTTLGGRVVGGLRLDFADGRLAGTGGSTGTLERDADRWTIVMNAPAAATASYLSIMLVRDGSTVFGGTENDAVTIDALSIDGVAVGSVGETRLPTRDLADARRPFVVLEERVDVDGGAAVSYAWPLSGTPDMRVSVARRGQDVDVRFEPQSDGFRAQFGGDDFMLRVADQDEDWFLTEFRRRLSRQRAAATDGDVQRFYGSMIAKLRPLFAGVVAPERIEQTPVARTDEAGVLLLGAIVCPLTERELPQALANLAAWNDDVPPAVEPLAQTERPRLVFAFNGAESEATAATLRAAYARAPNLHRSFAGIETIFLDLPPEQDVYRKSATEPLSPYGNKAGPNWMFRETMQRLRGDVRFAFLMETDCRPLAPDWLRGLIRTCARNDDAWVVGAHYTGASTIKRHVARHINGNAMYQIGDDDFWRFFTAILWPWMQDRVAVDPDIAYDCAWEKFLDRPDMESGEHADWLDARDVLHRFRLTDAIVNVGGYAEQSGNYVWTRQQLLRRAPNAVIVHGPFSDEEAHRRGAVSVGRPLLSGAADIAERTLTLSGDDALFGRSLWPADGVFAPGDTIAITLTVAGPGRQPVVFDLRSPRKQILYRQKLLSRNGAPRFVEMTFEVADRCKYATLSLRADAGSTREGPMRIMDVVVGVTRNGAPIATLEDFVSRDDPVAA